MTKITQILTALGLIVGSTIIGPPPARAASCTDLKIIFARGSGEKLGDVSYQDWRSSLSEQLATTHVSYSFYELGSESHGGARYSAVAVSGTASGFGNLLGAYISAGTGFDFGKSVDAGRQELQAYIAETSRQCPQTKFVLGGYSQGAMLISGLLPVLDDARIIYAATFGDPKLYLPEGAGNRPVACQGKNLSNYRAYVSDCRAYEGILGSYRPYQAPEYHNKLGTWCNAKDIMCSSGLNLGDHTDYTTKGLYKNAAQTIRAKVKQTWPEKFSSNDPVDTAKSPHDLAIILDVGGAMIFERLATYKAVARRLGNEHFSQGGRVALYYYAGTDKINTTQICDLSCSPAEFNRYLDGLNGLLSSGERYRSGLSALKTAMNELEWQVGATKSAVLLTAMPYSPRDRDGTTLQDVIDLSLTIDPVNVYSFADGYNLYDYNQALSVGTNGKVYYLDELDIAIDEIIGRPVATLALEEYSGIVGEEFVFDASDAGHASTVRYDWDLDADGSFEVQNSQPKITHIYQQPTAGFVQVKLTDASGYSSTMSAKLDVRATAPTLPIVEITKVTPDSADTYHFQLSGSAEKVLVVVDEAPLGYIDFTKQRDITITDLAPGTQVRFVAFVSNIGRGEASEYVIAWDEDGAAQSPSDSSRPSVRPRPTASQNPATTQPNNTDDSKARIPSAPNTGVPIAAN